MGVISRGYQLEFTSMVQRDLQRNQDTRRPEPRTSYRGRDRRAHSQTADFTNSRLWKLFRSSVFLTRIKGNLWRPILNRKPLNKGYIHLKGFHLENLSSIIPLLEEGMYVIGGRKYDEVDYQFKVLPFGFQQSLGCSQGYRFQVTGNFGIHLHR